MAQQPQNKSKAKCEEHKFPALGIILVVFGGIFLFQEVFKVNILGNLPWNYIWPTLVVVLGINIIYKKSK